MPSLSIEVACRDGSSATFSTPVEAPLDQSRDGIRLRYRPGLPAEIVLTPPSGTHLASICYRLNAELRNFHEVIVPDTGRTYMPQRQLVDFWGRSWGSRVGSVLMPLFIFTGQDRRSTLAFGVIGACVESDFQVVAPKIERALQAWMKELGLLIRRGTPDHPLPPSVAEAEPDGSVREWLYLRAGEAALGGETWHDTLRDFAQRLEQAAGAPPACPDAALEPWWCPWTDWHSDRVDHALMLAQAAAGRALGFRNFIIDDGWFGPGLDSPLDAVMTMGDWEPDPRKFPDLAATVRGIRDLGGNCILWCAPHAVFPASRAFARRRQLLIEKEAGVPSRTHNGYHPLCFRSPEARRAMADLCLELAERFGTQGAKYDLFNNVPGDACASCTHRHDTPSMLEGLRLLLAEIAQRTRARAPGFITELKQNYGTPWLHASGSCMRAGDTPYNPEGNFRRTAYINAYTPYALNDYQTLCNHDPLEAGLAMCATQLAAGIPAWSMDLIALAGHHRRSLAFCHDWYLGHLQAFRGWRRSLDPGLGAWRVEDGACDLCILLPGENRLPLRSDRCSEILVGCAEDRLLLRPDRPQALEIRIRSPHQGGERRLRLAPAGVVEVPTATGDLVTVTPA